MAADLAARRRPDEKQLKPLLDATRDMGRALKADDPVYKLMGKLLVRQDLADAKTNVAQRLQMIDRELCVARALAQGLGSRVKTALDHCGSAETHLRA